MNDFLEDLRKKIVSEINPEGISVIDNSQLHSKHKSFDKNKFHIKLILKSDKLNKMNKIEAHKKIFSILSEEIKNKLHAIEIKIL
mgnify:CR=1 FL=1|tara:strand:+ start:696 stop:950 length:255 start_codon:yes stop_codon:yes gene_type:complete